MTTNKIELEINPTLAEKLKLLKIWKNAGQPEISKVKTDNQLIELLINDAFDDMKIDPIGRKLFY